MFSRWCPKPSLAIGELYTSRDCCTPRSTTVFSASVASAGGTTVTGPSFRRSFLLSAHPAILADLLACHPPCVDRTTFCGLAGTRQPPAFFPFFSFSLEDCICLALRRMFHSPQAWSRGYCDSLRKSLKCSRFVEYRLSEITETLHDDIIYYALHVHTTFGDLDSFLGSRVILKGTKKKSRERERERDWEKERDKQIERQRQ